MDIAVPERPILAGKSVWLRAIEERDLPRYVAANNDREIGPLAGTKLPMTLSQAKSWQESAERAWDARTAFFFAVCELGSDSFIGTVWLRDVRAFDSSAELAVLMDAQHIGAGYGTDAQRIALRFAFATLGLNRVSLVVLARNARAIRSYEKLGFQREGVLRRAARASSGFEDLIVMSLLASEWNDQSETLTQ
jgi:RimJ/RimL family protein N-acetyltransferase